MIETQRGKRVSEDVATASNTGRILRWRELAANMGQAFHQNQEELAARRTREAHGAQEDTGLRAGSRSCAAALQGAGSSGWRRRAGHRPTDSREAKAALRKNSLRFALSLAATAGLLFMCFCTTVRAETGITIDLNSGDGTGGTGTLDLLFLTTILALLPSILMMMTSFTRIIIVLSFLRNALGTQQTPPNQVLVGLALFMTLFIMMPVINEINEQAYTPLKEGTITQDIALERASKPIKKFMVKQIDSKDLNLFLSLSESVNPSGSQAAAENPQSSESASSQADGSDVTSEPSAGKAEIMTQDELLNLGLEVLIPSFITSELKRAFMIGFLLFLPFLIIDMVVSSTLMSMGMVMLPPSMIALPFKIMIFVLVDGWNLLIGELISGFLKTT